MQAEPPSKMNVQCASTYPQQLDTDPTNPGGEGYGMHVTAVTTAPTEEMCTWCRP